MRIISVHSAGHDAGASYWENGALRYSVEAERLTRVRHCSDASLALERIKLACDIDPSCIDLFVISTPFRNSLLNVEDDQFILKKLRLGEPHVEGFCNVWGSRIPAIVVTHEYCHAALALHYSGYEDVTTVLVNEGRGTISRNSSFYYDKRKLKLTETDSLPWYGTGFGWSAIGFILGFGKNPSVAGKLMGMVGYEQPSGLVSDAIQNVSDRILCSDFRERVDAGQKLLRDCHVTSQFSSRATLVSSLQALFDNEVLSFAKRRIQADRSSKLALSGGCALNIITNSMLRSTLRVPVSIPPACNDSGQALGAAIYALKFVVDETPKPFSVFMNGGANDLNDAKTVLKDAGLKVSAYSPNHVAELIARGAVFGLASGKSEIGPRALGARSLIGHPSHKGMRRKLSERIKKREWYRPLAPVMKLASFEQLLPGEQASAHMLFNYNVSHLDIPEATHVDGTARIQTLDNMANPKLVSILEEFTSITRIPALLNTSLNAGGNPIAQTGEDIIDDFGESEVDGFVIGDWIGEK